MGKTTFLSQKWVLLGVFQVIITFFSWNNANAQEIISLRGKIVNDSLEDSYLHIMNLNMQRGTITDEHGTFHIPVRLNDTLFISSIQFETQKILVTKQIFSQKTLIITLKTVINELETVNISEVELSGRLDQDAIHVNVKPYFDQTDVGFGPTAKKRSVELRALQGAGDFGLGGLIDLMSGRKKMLKKIYAISVMEGRVKKAQTRFNTVFYIETLKIPEILIDDFCYFVYENDEEALRLAEEENPLMLIDFLMHEAQEFKDQKSIKD